MVNHTGKSPIEYLARHVVALVGTYVLCDQTNRESYAEIGAPPHAERKVLSFTGLPVRLCDTIYIATAGHIFAKHLPILESQKAFITGGSLADCFGPIKTGSRSFPFDLFGACEYWIDDSKLGLDYAMLRLSHNDAKLLESNSIVPYIPSDDLYQVAFKSRKHVLLGFAEENTALMDWQPGSVSHVAVKPSAVPIERLDDEPTERYPWLCGQIKNMGMLKSIVGTSGGPVFAITNEDAGTEYTVAGIQSSWNKSTRQTHATRIDCLIDHFWRWKNNRRGQSIS
jgi:hypothetical protein